MILRVLNLPTKIIHEVKMMNEKDRDVLELKFHAEADYREIGNAIRVSSSAASGRVLGFIRWQPGERERVIRFLQQRIEQAILKHE